MKILFGIGLILLLTGKINSQEIKISLFNDKNITSLTVTPINGTYSIQLDDTLTVELQNSTIFYLTLIGKKILLKDKHADWGEFTKIIFISHSWQNYFHLKAVSPILPTRIYDDNVCFTADINRIKIINTVDFDKYIAGVVEAEGGNKAGIEFYKSQAILCRTYALANINLFKEEGFNLCDNVACQAYKGRCSNNPDIIEATLLTKGLVVIDKDTNLITAAYHCNSGGYTQNSGVEWLMHKSYLTGKEDPYSKNKPNYKWIKKINIDEWKDYLISNGMDPNNTNDPQDFSFIQHTRKQYYTCNGFTLPLRKIREDWNLKSSFFSVVPKEGYLLFDGRGFGHGVGMSQEGAIYMAEKGYTYKDIIHFYFQDVYIIEYTQISNL